MNQKKLLPAAVGAALISIAPNETVKIKVSYAISYPKEGAVVGLP